MLLYSKHGNEQIFTVEKFILHVLNSYTQPSKNKSEGSF